MVSSSLFSQLPAMAQPVQAPQHLISGLNFLPLAARAAVSMAIHRPKVKNPPGVWVMTPIW